MGNGIDTNSMEFANAILLLQDPLKAVMSEMAGGDKVSFRICIDLIIDHWIA